MSEREQPAAPSEEWIAGRNAVAEALRAGRPIDRLLVAKGERSPRLGAILAQCRERGIPIKETDPRRMDELCGPHHQGVAAAAACKDYASPEDILALAGRRGEPPFIVLCDGLEDPHHLGAILRTAEAAGAHGVIVPRRRSVGLTQTVYKTSAGAVEYLPVARVANLAETIRVLKERGLWIFGLDMDGGDWCAADLTGGIGIVVGAEGQGLSRLVRERCDAILSLPMKGKIQSLNASVATGIVLYEAARQRSGIAAR